MIEAATGTQTAVLADYAVRVRQVHGRAPQELADALLAPELEMLAQELDVRVQASSAYWVRMKSGRNELVKTAATRVEAQGFATPDADVPSPLSFPAYPGPWYEVPAALDVV